jgi:hypothetical protein
MTFSLLNQQMAYVAAADSATRLLRRALPLLPNYSRCITIHEPL